MEDPLKRDFYIGCPKCIEPETTLKYGNHIEINVTVTNYGAKAKVCLECPICGSVKDISEDINLVSRQHFEEILAKSKDVELYSYQQEFINELKKGKWTVHHTSIPRSTEKQKKINLLYYLMCRCDMDNGKITNMTKDQIEDTWYESEWDDLIQLGQETCAKFNAKVTDPCPNCGQQLRAKTLQEGGGVECPNPKCDYWHCL